MQLKGVKNSRRRIYDELIYVNLQENATKRSKNSRKYDKLIYVNLQENATKRGQKQLICKKTQLKIVKNSRKWLYDKLICVNLIENATKRSQKQP